MADAGSFDSRAYNSAARAVASQDGISVPTIQSQCTRSLGLDGVNSFLTLCKNYFDSENDMLLSAMSEKAAPNTAVEIKTALDNIRCCYVKGGTP